MGIRTVPPFFCCLLIYTFLFTSMAFGQADGDTSQANQVDLAQWIDQHQRASRAFQGAGQIDSALLELNTCLNALPRQPENAKEFQYLAWVYAGRAYIYENNFGNYLQAKSDYLSALEQFTQANYENFYVARYIYQPLGNIYTRLGENEQAIRMLLTFQRICKESEAFDALPNSYNDLGRAYTNKSDFEQAISVYQEGIAVATGDAYNLGLLNCSLAETYFLDAQYDLGIQAAKTGVSQLQAARKSIDPESYQINLIDRYLVGANLVLGQLLSAQGAFVEAVPYFDQAIADVKIVHQTKHRKTAKVYLALAQHYQQADALEKAIQTYQKAFISVIPNFENTDPQVNPDLAVLYADASIGEGLLGKAQAAKAFYDQNQELKWLKCAYRTYLSYFQWEDLFRAEQQDIQSKLFFSSEIHGAGEALLLVISELNQHEPAARWGEEAFKIMEQCKGILLSESHSELLKQNTFENAAIAQLNQEKMQLSLLQIELKDAALKQDSSALEALTKKIEVLDKAHQLTLKQIRTDFPTYDRLVYQANDTIDFEAFKTYASQNKTNVLSFFVGQKHAFLVAFQDEKFELQMLDRERLVNLSTEFIAVLHKPQEVDATTYGKIAHQLYTHLTAKLDQSLTEQQWLILPDGILNRVPFEALVDEDPDLQHSFKTLPYVLHRRTVYYAPSAKFLLNPVGQTPPLQPYLGVAPTFEKNEKYPWLQHSLDEVGLGQGIFDGDALVQNSATKNAFLSRADQYRILHISTHAGSGSGHNDNWMAFNTSDSSPQAHLMAPELLQLNLHTELIALNACETGKGKFFEGEGTLSMARSFIEAGAKNVLTNLWQVNHQASASLIKGFYDHIEGNPAPAWAIQQSKIGYLKQENLDELGAHPFFWSAPILVGSNHTLSVDTQSFPWFVWFGVGFALILSAAILRKKRTKNAA